MDTLYRALLRYVALPIIIVIIAIIIQGLFQSKKEKQRQKKIDFQDDMRPLILYLRSFMKDGLSTTHSRIFFNINSPEYPITSFEMKLDKEVNRLGKFYAIANPNSTETEIGAVRDTFTNEEWEKQVLKKMDEAIMIVYRPAETEGTLWEFDQILEHKHLTKTVIAVLKNEWNEYAAFERRFKSKLPKLPVLNTKVMFICFDTANNVYVNSDLSETVLFRYLMQNS